MNLATCRSQSPVGPEAGQIMLMSPALLRGDKVMANLKVGAATGFRGNPAIGGSAYCAAIPGKIPYRSGWWALSDASAWTT